MPIYRISYMSRNASVNKIEGIKTIRQYTNLGLKEAKDVVELADIGPDGGTTSLPVINDFEELAGILARNGIKITNGLTNEFVNHREVLHVLCSDALQARNYVLAKDVIALIEKHF